jgi:hypothetical protein
VLPEIEIEVFDRVSKKPIGKHRNEVPSVPKDCDLIFTEPSCYSEYASVEWTVRNDGEESDYIGDLAIVAWALGCSEADEHTRIRWPPLHGLRCSLSTDKFMQFVESL